MIRQRPPLPSKLPEQKGSLLSESPARTAVAQKPAPPAESSVSPSSGASTAHEFQSIPPPAPPPVDAAADNVDHYSPMTREAIAAALPEQPIPNSNANATVVGAATLRLSVRFHFFLFIDSKEMISV